VTRTCACGLGKCDKNTSLKRKNEKSPWRCNSTPLGPRGLHPAGALARTHRNLKKQNPIPTGAGTNQATANPQGECTHSPRGSGATVGYRRTGYHERMSKGSLKSHQKTKLEGKPWAPHRPRPSPPASPPRLEPHAEGLGVLTQSPPRTRLFTEGLGREYDLRLVRGLTLRLARGQLIRSPSPPASTDPPGSTSCPINTSTTPTISAGRWLDTIEWSTGPEVASTPYRLGQGTAGITGHCVLTLCP
jgi:hypothetical protein